MYVTLGSPARAVPALRSSKPNKGIKMVDNHALEMNRSLSVYDKFEWFRKKKKKKKGKKKGKGKKKYYTAAPTISQQPSISPKPSSEPSLSVMPSSQPSSSPTSFPTLTPSLRPSLSPSSHPTDYPTLTPSLQPSSEPTSSPTDYPTLTPSLQPSSRPSSSPTDYPTLTPSLQPSSRPSSSPTSKPSNVPSEKPSQFPSLLPSEIPSDKPSRKPSSIPSTYPSLVPSAQPSLSAYPSTVPSISQMPSINIMTVKEKMFDINGVEIGIKSGCAPPKVEGIDEDRYAEENLKELTFQFHYLVEFEDADENEILKTLDYAFEEFIFNDFITCQGETDTNTSIRGLRHDNYRGTSRRTQALKNGKIYDKDLPMGVSSLPRDKLSTDYECESKRKKGPKKCMVIEGGTSIFFEREADINSENQGNLLMFDLKDKMKDWEIASDDKRIKKIELTKWGDESIGSSEAIVKLNRNDDESKQVKPKISLTGSVVITTAALIMIAGILAIVRMRRNSGYAEKNLGVHAILDKEYDGDFSDDDDDHFNQFSPDRKKFRQGNDDMQFPVILTESRHKHGSKKYLQMRTGSTDPDEFSQLSQQGRKRRRQTSEQQGFASFPVKMTETRNGKSFPVSRGYEKKRSEVDVHKCTSALCKECGPNSKSRIQFISSNDWYDDIEVDFDNFSDKVSDRTMDFSKPSMQDRFYDIKNTVYL
jgi:hypothetical protein